MKRNNKKGFTIVELVIVIAVIAILSAVLIPTFGTVIADAQATALKQELRNGYTEAFAEDLSDNKLDGLKDGAAIENYTYTNGKGLYTITENNVPYTFDGENFTGFSN